MATEQDYKPSWLSKVKSLVIGGRLNPFNPAVFQNLALASFFAWVGLGSDGLSSSCYGPQETFLALRGAEHLAIFVAMAVAVTIIVIGASYSQVVELFPTGGGGYLVASKLLSPTFGMIAGSALLIDYVLTIAISIASGTDALFSFLPENYHFIKLEFALAGIVLLTITNLRGVKESVLPLVPIFLIFVFTHLFFIVYAIGMHASEFPNHLAQTSAEVHRMAIDPKIGIFGILYLIMRAYSMGAGTYTGLEAVSNGIPLLREPRVHTARQTMVYMIISLSFVVVGLIISYLLFSVNQVDAKTLATKTLNAVLFEKVTNSWHPTTAFIVILITLISEAAILFIAAQTGFLGGPRVLANMALDRWLPTRLAILSDRLVTQNGVIIMGVASFAMMILTQGSVGYLVVLYSINVFITFVLTMMGLVRHWVNERAQGRSYKRKILVAGISLVLCTFILVTITALKFSEGGWITLLITGAFIVAVSFIKQHYKNTSQLLRRLDERVLSTLARSSDMKPQLDSTRPEPKYDPAAKTAVLLVNGFNGLGLHTLFNINRLFGAAFKNFIFIEVGVIDAGNFKGTAEIEHLKNHSHSQAQQYVELVKRNGFFGECYTSVTTDVVEEIANIAQDVLAKYPTAVFFGGQLVFPKELYFGRWLHNNIIFAVQRRFYYQGIPIVILPIRVY